MYQHSVPALYQHSRLNGKRQYLTVFSMMYQHSTRVVLVHWTGEQRSPGAGVSGNGGQAGETSGAVATAGRSGFSATKGNRHMSTTKRSVPAQPRRSVPALDPADSLSMLRSAVGYDMQYGLMVQAKTLDGGKLLIIVTGAAVDYAQPGAPFVPAQDVPAFDADSAGTVLVHLADRPAQAG